MECQCLFNAMSAVLVIPGRTKGTKEKKGGGRETVSFYCHINNVDHTGENRKKVSKKDRKGITKTKQKDGVTKGFVCKVWSSQTVQYIIQN